MLFVRAKRWLRSFKQLSAKYTFAEKKAIGTADIVLPLNMAAPLAYRNFEKN